MHNTPLGHGIRPAAADGRGDVQHTRRPRRRLLLPDVPADGVPRVPPGESLLARQRAAAGARRAHATLSERRAANDRQPGASVRVRGLADGQVPTAVRVRQGEGNSSFTVTSDDISSGLDKLQC